MTATVVVKSLIERVTGSTAKVMNLVFSKDCFHLPQVVLMQVFARIAWWNNHNVVSLVLVEDVFNGYEQLFYLAVHLVA